MVRRPGSSPRGHLMVLAGILAGFGHLSCQGGKPTDPVRRAQFGIFYGGDVQEREQIPFQLDRTKQTHGIRLEFTQPLAEATSVVWEFDMPSPGYKGRETLGQARGAGHRVKVDRALIPAGRSSFDQVFWFQPGDPLGPWRILVKFGEREVINRAFEVYDPNHPPGKDGGPQG